MAALALVAAMWVPDTGAASIATPIVSPSLTQQAVKLQRKLTHERGLATFCRNHKPWQAKHKGTCLAARKAVAWETKQLGKIRYRLATEHLRATIVADTRRLIGVPYLFGGEALTGLDCSGLVQYVFREVGIYVPRSTFQQYAYGKPVARANLQPGDVVYAYPTWSGPDHALIYVGGGNVIDAPHTGSYVGERPLAWFNAVYVGARCFLGPRCS